ncbi:hypothetical protein LSPCS325_10180 [Lysinibacillus sp. CTST325]
MAHTSAFYMAIGSAVVLCAVVLDLGYDKTLDEKDKM